MNFLKAILIAMFLIVPTVLRADDTSVTVSKDTDAYTLANGIVTAEISKRSGSMLSLKYHGQEMLDTKGRQAAFWSHNTERGQLVDRVTINPEANDGERAEVSIKGISAGNPMGRGPGGSVIADIEIRYALGRGDSGVYTYCIFTHPANYPATSFGEARYCLKLNDKIFDWMTVDANRNMEMITAYDWNHGTRLNMKEARRMNSGIDAGRVEHKYDYSANQFDVRAWGWSSTEDQVGLWLVNPSVEYLSGGPTKFELSAHRDATFNTNALNAPAPPTLLNYWRGSHYGGSIANIAQNESWTKVVGPFLIYCNSGGDHNALWYDALMQAGKESAKWPFDWVNGVDYPHRDERATVSGKIVLNDPQAPGLQMSNLLVGVTAPDYAPAIIPHGGSFSPAGGGEDETNYLRSYSANAESTPPNARARPGRGGGSSQGPRIVDWQDDAKDYEFWVHADAAGNFVIPNVRAGKYVLHAIADGVLGDLTVSNIVAGPGDHLALGNVNWQPVRYGRQLWDIGIPNRNASEFFEGNDYYHWGWYLDYPKMFPNDVHYVIGKSDFRKDWFFEQVPHCEDPNDLAGTSQGRSTTWTISFNLPEAPRGKAILRLAICGVGARTLTATMNDQSIGVVNDLVYNATINRDGIGGYWKEHDITFDASAMRAGENDLLLTIPAGGLTSGIMYDYLRLELNDSAAAVATN